MSEQNRKLTPWKTIAALGVVFGDIGTSPLYALRECFTGSRAIALTEANVLGVMSLVFWSLIIVISVKYMMVVLNADNRGEGGILSLTALINPHKGGVPRMRRIFIIYLGLFGAALLYGDGVITPAISVLSAVEGLELVAPQLSDFILFITIVILFFLFYSQKYGTSKIGAIFGPVLLLWFFVIGLLGLFKVLDNPIVLFGLNPAEAISFFAEHKWHAFVTLGAVFLVVTGGESIYADMGHFGKAPIRVAWFTVALPALVLNYLGQGALLLSNPKSVNNPFYLLAPSWALAPLVVLATMATVIASQAVISGAFSLTNQAVQLGYLPRMKITHTSDEEAGQIYVDFINWVLLLLTIALVLEFKSSSALASAYGIAVSGTMVITSILITFVCRRIWNWSLAITIAACGVFIVVDAAFFSANIIRIHEGGWVPFAMAIGIYTIMTTWRTGRSILSSRLSESLLPVSHFIKGVEENPPVRIPGTAIFMNRNNNRVPQALVHNVKHNKVLHEKNILLMVEIEDVPYVSQDERVQIENLAPGFQRMNISYGFMEVPDVPFVLENIKGPDKISDFTSVTFFLGKETLFAAGRPGMALWREKLFAVMSKNAQPATNFFRIPKERVVEIGLQIEL